MEDNILLKLADILVAAAVMFIIPVIYVSVKADNIRADAAAGITAQFAETVSSRGYIDGEDYRLFIDSLSAAGSYEVAITHSQEVAEPEYLSGTFTGSVMHYTDITYTGKILDEIDAYGAYLFDIGDEVTVTVTKRGRTPGSSVINALFKREPAWQASYTRTIAGVSMEQYEKYYR